MAFTVFTKKRQPATTEPAVTLQKKGSFSLNASAYDALGRAEAVELLYDPDERLIGLRPAPPDSPNSYPVRAVSKGTSSYLVAGTAFAKYYGIELGVARRWIAEGRDGMLVINLKDPGVVVTSNRPSRPETSERSLFAS